MTLTPSEYDIKYFDGMMAKEAGQVRHPAGYSHYRNSWGVRTHRIQPFIDHFSLTDYIGKKVLELGCAKGFFVKMLRDLGVNAFGMDISDYAAVDTGIGYVDGYMWQGDVRTDLATIGNKEYNLVYSIGLFECLAEAEVAGVVSEVNRIAKKQIHLFEVISPAAYYLVRSISWWAGQGFANKTILAGTPGFVGVVV